MKKIYLSVLFIGISFCAFAKHITGGEVFYDFLREGNNSKFYRITLVLFRDNFCGGGCAALPTIVGVGLFNNDNNQLVGGFRNINISREDPLPILAAPGCLSNPPNFNYSGGYYIAEIELPNNVKGYTYAYQTCCRISGIQNIPPLNNAQDQGATYVSLIPGSEILQNTLNDNSSRFQTGISILCYDKKYVLDFSATDPDGDSLVYSLCPGYDGGAATNAGYATPAAPPYNSLIYNSGFSGLFPFGDGTSTATAIINPQTGIITGRAPAIAGQYVVSVCVSSYRNGRFINEHRKDFVITVSACDFAGAELDPTYSFCKDLNVSFSNLNNSPLNTSFLWYFGDGTTSTEQNPMHTYADTGTYTIKLVVNGGGECADSTTQILSLFPTFRTDFTSNAPVCKGSPVQFTDGTFATYGPVNGWTWNFGDPSSGFANTSTVRNPTHTYATPGTYTAQLISKSQKGCIDTLSKPISIVDKPFFKLTNDTLICSIDTLQLNATVTTSGTITWSPNYNISDINSFTPLVSPDVTTTYVATFFDASGCFATDSVRVRVVDFVTLSNMPDTVICRTDSVQLRIISDGLTFSWTPSELLVNPNVQNPIAFPSAANTIFRVRATIGKCSKETDIAVKTVPYPVANAGPDSLICYGRNIQLQATGGSIYTWSPPFFLNATNIPNPVSIRPTSNITYIVTVRDTLGCPKPVNDSVLIKVVRILADAGPRDTAVVLGQPLQLNGTGGTIYNWTPSTYLSSTTINNPVSNPKDSIIYYLRVSDANGCFGLDTINVRLFKIPPGLYVPTAFTPNENGLNDVFRPIALGIKTLNYFRVYNRWGELVYSTSKIGAGWDGKYKGNRQGTSTFVWTAEAIDYTGKKFQQKGTVVLIL